MDAKAVFDTLKAEAIKAPVERDLILPLLAATELLDHGVLSRLYWVDMLAMLADGLTKGSVGRGPLVRAGQQGCWLLDGTGSPVCVAGSRGLQAAGRCYGPMMVRRPFTP